MLSLISSSLPYLKVSNFGKLNSILFSSAHSHMDWKSNCRVSTTSTELIPLATLVSSAKLKTQMLMLFLYQCLRSRLKTSGAQALIPALLHLSGDLNTTIVCFIPSVHFSDFFYVNNRLWFEIYGNRWYKSIVTLISCFSYREINQAMVF